MLTPNQTTDQGEMSLQRKSRVPVPERNGKLGGWAQAKHAHYRNTGFMVQFMEILKVDW